MDFEPFQDIVSLTSENPRCCYSVQILQNGARTGILPLSFSVGIADYHLIEGTVYPRPILQDTTITIVDKDSKL